MHAVQSALAIRRERERRQSLKDQLKDGKNNGRKSSGASMPGPLGGNAGPVLPTPMYQILIYWLLALSLKILILLKNLIKNLVEE